jgi:hypothetical protein
MVLTMLDLRCHTVDKPSEYLSYRLAPSTNSSHLKLIVQNRRSIIDTLLKSMFSDLSSTSIWSESSFDHIRLLQAFSALAGELLPKEVSADVKKKTLEHLRNLRQHYDNQAKILETDPDNEALKQDILIGQKELKARYTITLVSYYYVSKSFVLNLKLTCNQDSCSFPDPPQPFSMSPIAL